VETKRGALRARDGSDEVISGTSRCCDNDNLSFDVREDISYDVKSRGRGTGDY
jgi:hypothetical protein